MEELACNWSPRLIVELIKNIVWPLVVLLIVIRFHSNVLESIRSFLSRNTVSEISASTSGVSAKFVMAKQSSAILEAGSFSGTSLPKNMSAEALRDRYEQQKTKFSEELNRGITIHLSALNISTEEKVDLLAQELSILKSAVRYLDINKVLFRSQYDLLYFIACNGGYIPNEGALHHFKTVKDEFRDFLSDWDWIKYIAYPVSNSLIYEDGNGYKLTSMGESYIAFMSKNPQLVDELTKL